jgi:hypothetical protein
MVNPTMITRTLTMRYKKKLTMKHNDEIIDIIGCNYTFDKVVIIEKIFFQYNLKITIITSE